jgi:hypothetical protein
MAGLGISMDWQHVLGGCGMAARAVVRCVASRVVIEGGCYGGWWRWPLASAVRRR